MDITKEFMKDLNTAYHDLDMKRFELLSALFHRIFEVESGWYSNHYEKSDENTWQRDSYPIPVISVKEYCDIEIPFDRVRVSSKLKKADALAYSFGKFQQYVFEAFGVEDYLSDLYHEGQTIEDLKTNILSSHEKEIEFQFMFPFHVNGPQIFEFVKLLRREGFYY